MKPNYLTDTSLNTNTPSIEGAEEFDRHVLDPQYYPNKLKKLKNLTDTFLITNTVSIEEAEAEEFGRHVHDHQYSLHWRSWRVWQTHSWSPILPPLKKLKSLTDTFLITNTPSIEGANEFERHVLDHQYSPSIDEETEEFDRHVLGNQYSAYCRSWRVWQTRSWSPILPPLEELMSLRCTSLITNTPSIYEAEEFDRHVLDNQYSVHWRSWRVWETPFWSPILPPFKKLKNLTDTFLITNTASIEEAEEFDGHVLDHQYSLHWRSWRVWQTRSWSPILPTLKKQKNLTDTFLITNTVSIEEADAFDRHVLDHQYSLHWRSWRVWQTHSWSPILPPIEEAVKFDRHVLDHQYSLP